MICPGFVAAQDQPSEAPQVGPDHKFLTRFVGEWDCDGEAYFEPGKPPVKSKSSMTGKMIGRYWAIVVVKGEMLGQPYHGQGTFGYDSYQKKKYIGTWADSMSEFLWKYEGVADGDNLVLYSEGPNPDQPGKLVKLRDTWEFRSPDLIILTSEAEGPDGKMVTGMKATCTRRK
jgi:hypothetical protein